MAQSLADIPGESDMEPQAESVRIDLFAANRRVIELESAVKYLRYIMSDLDVEIANARKHSAHRRLSPERESVGDASSTLPSPDSPPLASSAPSGVSHSSTEQL